MLTNKWIAGIVIFIVALVGFNIYLFTQLPGKKSSTPVLHPTPQLTPGYKVIQGTGRNILYKSSVPLTFGGSGIVETNGVNNVYVGYVVGILQGWESISLSKDKYILVKEPESNTIHKVRTTWTDEKSSSMLLVKEDITKIGTNGLENGYLMRIGTIDDSEELYPGRVVTVLFKTNAAKKDALTDENNIPIGDAVVIR